MKTPFHPLLDRYIGKPLILDSNVLLLYWCSSYDPGLVGSFKRLNSFTYPDVALLQKTIKLFKAIHTTPHVLTEVSNLAKSMWIRKEWVGHFALQIDIVDEDWIAAKEIVRTSAMYLGLTDATLCNLATKYVILTIDFPLSNYLETKKLNVINFNHLRE